MATSQQFRKSSINPASGTFGRRNAARYVGGTVAGESHASVKSYMIGFVLSLVLTAIPFGLVMDQGHYGLTPSTVMAATVVGPVTKTNPRRRLAQFWTASGTPSHSNDGISCGMSRSATPTLPRCR